MTVTFERRDEILVVTLRRPDRRNALDAGMTEGLDEAFNLLEDDPQLRVGVLAAEGAVFSAGTDLRSGSGAPTPRGGEYGLVRRRRDKPLIAAVDGPALGGGFELVLACDLVVASSTASFGLPEVQRGVIAACGGLFRAGRSLPQNIAHQLLLTGQPLDAERAHAFGLVNILTDPGTALDAALSMAADVCRNAPVSVRESLRATRSLHASADGVGWHVTEEAFKVILSSEDLHEALAAFAEKRAPRWSHR